VDARNLARLVPDAAMRGQLQAIFDANPQLQERFPGGVVQFAQVAAQLPEEFFEDLMIGQDAANFGMPAGGMGMPGGMPGDEQAFDEVEVEFVDGERGQGAGDGRPAAAPGNNDAVMLQQNVGAAHEEIDDEMGDAENGEEEEDEEEEIPILPVRILRGLMSRFWGGSAAQAADDSESDDADRPGGSGDRDGGH